MDCTAEIRQWLDSEGSYLAGVDLLKRVSGKLPTQVAIYAQRPAITVAIYDDLADLLKSQIPTGYEATKPVTQQTTNEPEAIQALRKRGIVLKKEEAAVHGKLKALGLRSDAHLYQKELHQLALQMMTEIQPALDEVYGALRAWEREGKLPVPGEDRIIAETVAKMRRRESLKQSRSHIKARIKKGGLTDTEVKRMEADMEKKLQEQREIEQELGL